jgi:hypothetical protein
MEEKYMKEPQIRMEAVEKIIRKSEIQTFKKILNKMNCSSITLRRDIKAIGGITSFTHRGEYVTLVDIPVYDKFGIWFYKDIGFTKFKNSFDLIVSIINNAEKGITKEEIEELLRIKISKQIQILLSQNRLHRIKLGARYRYFSEELAKDKKRQIQLLDFEEYYDKKVSIADIIAVLKAVLFEHKIDMSNLKKLVQKYSLDVPIKKIEQLLLKYDLASKKKP